MYCIWSFSNDKNSLFDFFGRVDYCGNEFLINYFINLIDIIYLMRKKLIKINLIKKCLFSIDVLLFRNLKYFNFI